jgi:hypothetical protein
MPTKPQTPPQQAPKTDTRDVATKRDDGREDIRVQIANRERREAEKKKNGR